MKKLSKLILMLCLVFSGAFCIARSEKTTIEAGEGIRIGLIEAISSSEPSRGNSIIPSINGHVLTVVFNENIGQVSVEVATMAGASVQCLSVLTPNGLQVYIPNVGNYIVTFTLSNGDEYYGEFTVTD